MATGNAVKFAYYAGDNVPSSYDNDTIYFLEGPKQIKVGSKLLGNVDENAVSVSQLQTILESYTVKTVEVTGTGNVIANASFNSASSKLTLTKGTLPVLSKGAASTNSQTLEFGGNFEAITSSSVSDHTITDTKTQFTMPTIVGGNGIQVSGNTVSLPQAFYDYLVAQTFSTPTINTFTVNGLGSDAEVGTSVTVTGITHAETAIGGFSGKLSLKHGSTTLKADINPSTSATTVTISSVTVTRNTAGTETFTLSGETTIGTSVTKSVSKNFYIPKFLGSSTSDSVSANQILNMTKGKNIPTSITISSTSYIYFVTDGAINSVKDTDTGFGVPVESPVTTAVSINGVSVNYHVYRTTEQIMPGLYNFTIA